MSAGHQSDFPHVRNAGTLNGEQFARRLQAEFRDAGVHFQPPTMSPMELASVATENLFEAAAPVAEGFFQVVGGVLGDLSGVDVSDRRQGLRGHRMPPQRVAGPRPGHALQELSSLVNEIGRTMNEVGRNLEPAMHESLQQLQQMQRAFGGNDAWPPPAGRGASLATLNATTAIIVHEGEGGGRDAGTNQCMVCLETFEQGEELRILPCIHRFHKVCIDRWLMQRSECPTCKNRIGP